VAELGELLKVNPGTALYHVRRLQSVDLLHLANTEKKRGIIEKRYRSAGRTVEFRPPAEEATSGALAPVLSAVGKALRGIDPARAVEHRATAVGHIAEARIGPAQQRVVAQRLAELAQYIEGLPEEAEGVRMVLAAGFGPEREPREAERAASDSARRSQRRRKRGRRR
jgi:predicted ArsR family transcriptional regulator